MLLLQDTHNQQNDIVYAASLADVPKNKLALQRFQNASKMMVLGGISQNFKIPLLFIE